MEAEITAIIEKDLPAQVGAILKKRLEQGERDVIDLKTKNEMIVSKNATIVGLEKKIEDYQKLDERNRTLEARENKVSEDERNLKISTLEYKLEAEKEKTTFSKDVALGLVRNIEYRKHIMDCQSQGGYPGPNGTWIQPSSINKSFEEKKSAE